MKKTIVLILSLSLIGSIYYIYDNLNIKEELIIKEYKPEEYKLEEEFISYTLNGSSTDISYEELTSDYMVNTITCENGSVAEWNEDDKSIKLSSINVPDYCTIDFKLKPKGTLAQAILVDNHTISERTDFSVTNVANTTGTIYKTNKTEDGSEVYYYSGNTTNNWVYFGGFYWRIIRTNEDGSVRLLYAGISHDTTSGYISASRFANTYIPTYMWGGDTNLEDNRTNTTSSIIKGVIDTWYQNNLLESYDKYISKTAIYCNDRSDAKIGGCSPDGCDIYCGALVRLEYNKAPNYKCGTNASGGLFESTQAVEDKFSVSTAGGGNGQLTYPIALMTADEVSFAGGVVEEELSSTYAWYYLNSIGNSITGSNWWFTMSPRLVPFETDIPSLYIVCNLGTLSSGRPSKSYYVRPVISIDQCAKVTGTGTPTDPYIIDEVNSTC